MKKLITFCLLCFFSISVMAQSSSFLVGFSPSIGYQVTPRFSTTVGLLHYNGSNSSFIPAKPIISKENKNNNFGARNLIHLQAAYAATQKLTLSGTIYYQPQGDQLKESAYKAMTLGMDYKLSPRATIGFKATMLQTNGNPFYASPFMGVFPLQSGFNNLNSFGTNPSIPYYKNNFN